MLALNIKQEPKRIIFDRFNALNALQLNPDDFILSPPEVYPDSNRQTNTRVQVSPLLDSTGYNSFYIYYSRMNVAEIFDRVNSFVGAASAATLDEILDVINVEFGIYMLPDDVEHAEIQYSDPLDMTLRATVDVTTVPTSFLFIGSHTLLLNTTINPYDPGVKNAVTGVAFTSDDVVSNVVNVNTSISETLYFGFLDGVTINNPPVIKGIKLVGDAAYVFGDFDLDVPTNIPGSLGIDIYQAVTVNRIGKVLAVDKVAKFDNVYQKDLHYVSKPDGLKHYVADQRKYISNGNPVGLYRYNSKGERDNTLITTNMSLMVDKVLPLTNGFIAASVQQETPKRFISIQRYAETGSINSVMPEIQISDAMGIDIEVQGMVPSYDATGALDGFYVLLSNIFSQSIIPVVNGNKVYGTKYLNKNNYILPVLKFSLEGIVDTNFNGNLTNAAKDFFQPEIGVYYYDRLFSLSDGFIIFNKVRNPITGVSTLVGLRVRNDGSLVLLDGGDYFDLPMVKKITAIVQNNNTFLASVIVDEIDGDGDLVEKPKVIGFDANGVFTGVYLELESPLSIKDMVIFKN